MSDYIEIEINRDIYKSASKYFELYKKYKKKAEKIQSILLEYNKKLEEFDKLIKKEENKITIRKKEWYHKFRWFFTSNDFLVVIGKDAITNEILIKKYMEENDIVLHADKVQSPFGLLKNGKDAKEEDIYEAAKFVGSFSKAWKMGLSSIDVFYVYPDQVSKKAPSGEYLSRGAFMIYGKKNYVRVPLEISLGVDKEFIPGVPESVSKKAKKYIILIPGSEKVSNIVKKVSSMLNVDENLIQQFIPGPSYIKKIVV